MADSPCSLLIERLKSLYNLENLDEFMSWTKDQLTNSIKVTIKDKQSDNEIASIWTRFKSEEKTIRVALVSRRSFGNYRNFYYKGLGKVLLYIVVCKAIDLGYTVSFSANPSPMNKLSDYYKEIGFTVLKDKEFLTAPSRNNFNSRILQTIDEMKNISTVESFEPIWEKREEYNDWIIKCPICNATSGSSLQLNHRKDCPNKLKIPDLSKRPSEGGQKKTRSRKYKSRKTRKMQSKRFF
jgi:hypothetical protein